MSLRSVGLLFVAVGFSLLSSAPASSQGASRFERTADGWVLHENGQQFRVDSSVVSLRFVDRETNASDRLEAMGELDSKLVGLRVLRVNRLGVVDVQLSAGADPILVTETLRSQQGVEFAEPNTMGEYTATPNDTDFGTQWNLSNTGQSGGTSGADVSAVDAWDIQDGDPAVAIAVLDSGTQWDHPDLASNIWSNSGETINGVDSDGNGFVDDVRGWDFDGNDNDPNGTFFHGTFVAGCVAASSNNGQGIAALAGGAVDGQGCSIMPLNVGSSFPIGSVLDDAILYAADNGAKVITLSLSVGTSSAIDAAVDYAVDVKGVFVDCASGNNGPSVAYPANLPKIMAVASTNHLDSKSGFSNPGTEVEVAAPGESVLSTNLGGGYTTSSGTSFAAPHVAALAGLLFSEDNTVTASAVRSIIRATADDVSTVGFDTGTGDGRIHAHEALLALTGGGLAGQALSYGAGTPGFGAQTPEIGTRSGVPTLGDSTFGITLKKARPNALTYNLLSLASTSVPAEGGILLVDLSTPPVFVMTFTTSANGGALRSLPIPNDPSFAGLQAYSQWVIVDPDGPAGYAFSDGLDLIIGD
ncbi:MAG: S8 family serine peptidase [Planctomycetota bacterium]|nr:S8 family serine peptidase [Planctomycetota bacterium]